MTREEISKIIQTNQKVGASTRFWAERLIDRIHADFKLELEAEYRRGWNDRHTQSDLEGRTCKSCKHITVGDEWTNGCSHKEIYDCYDDGSYVIPTDFFCNRWEQR